MDECRVTLEGPDGLSSDRILNGHQDGDGIRRQQGIGLVKFWSGIKGDVIIGPY